MEIGFHISSGYRKCRHPKCQRNSDHIDSDGYIKENTTSVYVTVEDGSGGATGHYCKGCIDLIFEDLKKTFNSKLWNFL